MTEQIAGATLATADTHQFLTFALGQEEYGVEILKIQEIKGFSAITPLPNAPAYVKGVLNLRGAIVPIVDLRKKFGLPEEAYTKFTPELAPGGILITEEELVQPHNLRKDIRHFSIPATRIAEELGKKLVVNIVMMGFLTAVTKVVGQKAMEQAVLASVPKGTEELNTKAFQRGYDYGVEVMEGAVTV